jgi:hypothetical protein
MLPALIIVSDKTYFGYVETEEYQDMTSNQIVVLPVFHPALPMPIICED